MQKKKRKKNMSVRVYNSKKYINPISSERKSIGRRHETIYSEIQTT